MIKQFDKFVNRRVGGIQIFVDGKGYDNIASIKGDEWRKRRHFVSPAFSGRKMRLMEPLIKDSLTRLVNKLSNSPENSMESLDAYSKCIMEVILSTAFGRSIDVQGGKGGEIYEDARDLFQFLSGKRAMAMRLVQFIMSAFTYPVI
jgi:thromboxane-A synthase